MMKHFSFLCLTLLLLLPYGGRCADATSVEIPLVEIWSMGTIGGTCSPLDDSEQSGSTTCPTNPNQFRAALSGRTLVVTADTGNSARVEVVNLTTGTKTVSKSFHTSTVEQLPAAGHYAVEIQSAGTTVGGYFEVR